MALSFLDLRSNVLMTSYNNTREDLMNNCITKLIKENFESKDPTKLCGSSFDVTRKKCPSGFKRWSSHGFVEVLSRFLGVN